MITRSFILFFPLEMDSVEEVVRKIDFGIVIFAFLKTVDELAELLKLDWEQLLTDVSNILQFLSELNFKFRSPYALNSDNLEFDPGFEMDDDARETSMYSSAAGKAELREFVCVLWVVFHPNSSGKTHQNL